METELKQEDDEDPKAIRAAFDAGVHGVTAHPALHISDPHVGTTTRVETDVTDESVTAHTLRIMREEWTAPFRAALEAAQDEIEVLLSEKEALRAELARQGVVTDHTVGCAGDRCETCEAIRPSICPACSAGDHSRHRPRLAGVCIGCACVVAS